MDHVANSKVPELGQGSSLLHREKKSRQFLDPLRSLVIPNMASARERNHHHSKDILLTPTPLKVREKIHRENIPLQSGKI